MSTQSGANASKISWLTNEHTWNELGFCEHCNIPRSRAGVGECQALIRSTRHCYVLTASIQRKEHAAWLSGQLYGYCLAKDWMPVVKDEDLLLWTTLAKDELQRDLAEGLEGHLPSDVDIKITPSI